MLVPLSYPMRFSEFPAPQGFRWVHWVSRVDLGYDYRLSLWVGVGVGDGWWMSEDRAFKVLLEFSETR